MSAVLSDLDMRESRNDMLTMSVIVGTNSAMHSFRSQVGNGTSSHDFTGDSLMICCISTSVASIKVVSGVPEKEVFLEPHLYKPGNPNGQYFVVKEGTEIVCHISLTGMQWKDCFSTVTHHISC